MLIQDINPIPVMYTLGDNEWVDCDRKGDSELTKLAYLRARFFKTPPVNSAQFHYRVQKAQVENARWQYAGVHFATLHIPGTNNAPQLGGIDDLAKAKMNADARDTANQAWLDLVFKNAKNSNARAVIISLQADIVDKDNNNPKTIGISCQNAYKDGNQVCDGFAHFRKSLAKHSGDFKRPVLLVHGDTHDFTLNQDMLSYGAPNLWRLNGAGDGVRDVTLVNVDLGKPAPFAASGLINGKIVDR